MSAHVCDLPARDGRTLSWTCESPGCGWRWRLNPIVARWFRDVP